MIVLPRNYTLIKEMNARCDFPHDENGFRKTGWNGVAFDRKTVLFLCKITACIIFLTVL